MIRDCNFREVSQGYRRMIGHVRSRIPAEAGRGRGNDPGVCFARPRRWTQERRGPELLRPVHYRPAAGLAARDHYLLHRSGRSQPRSCPTRRPTASSPMPSAMDCRPYCGLNRDRGGQLAENVSGTNVYLNSERHHLHAHRHSIDRDRHTGGGRLRLRRFRDRRLPGQRRRETPACVSSTQPLEATTITDTFATYQHALIVDQWPVRTGVVAAD